MTAYCSILLVASLGCFSLAHIALIGRSENAINRVIASLILSISCWTFIEILAQSADTSPTASFLFSFMSFKIITAALILHAVFTLDPIPLKRLNPFIIITIYCITLALGFLLFAYNNVIVVKTVSAWNLSFSNSILTTFSMIITTTLVVISLMILVIRFIRTESTRLRKQILCLIVGIIILTIGNYFSENLRLTTDHSYAIVLLVSNSSGAIFLLLAIIRFKPFDLSTREAAGIIVKTMSDVLIVVNMDRRIEIVNSAAVKMLGYSENELLGKRPEVIIGRLEGSDEPITRLLRSGVISDVRTYLRKKSGDSIPVSLSWSVLRDSDQKIVGIVFIGRDMSERERAQELLQQASSELEKRIEERTGELKVANEQLRVKVLERENAENQLSAEKEWLAVTLQSIGDGVITTDSSGNITSLNPAAEHLTGWTDKEASGNHFNQIYKCVQRHDDGDIVPENTFLQLTSGNPDKSPNSQSILISRDGIRYTVMEHTAPIIDTKGTMIGYVFVVRDITEQALLERELFRIKKLESINHLAGGIAHDFNNLLTSIVTNLFMAKMELTSGSEAVSLITNAEKAAFRASNLTKQLLQFSKNAAFSKEQLSIREVIESSVGFYLSESKCDYKLEFDNEISDIMIDRGQIDQVLNNVVSNADEAMPNGGTIVIDVKNTLINYSSNLPIKNGKYVQIAITDEGPGIDESIINRIFDPYFTTRKNSNGLGLTTAFVIVQKHGGHITVESRKDKGTTFNIYIPAVDNKEADEEQEQVSVLVNKSNHILLMDDEEIIRKSTKKVLNHLGYDVTLAENGEQALAIIKEHADNNNPFFAVILDLTVHAGKGATDIVSDIMSLDSSTKVILSSGYANDSVMVNYRQYGFHAAISKPYEIDNLAAVLKGLADSDPVASAG